MGLADGTVRYWRFNEGAGGGWFEQTGVSNPARFVDVSSNGGYASPVLADIDGDGDFDLFVGAADGTVSLYENTDTTVGRSKPLFELVTGTLAEGNPFSGIDFSQMIVDGLQHPGGDGFSLIGATVDASSYTKLDIQLTEAQRVHALLRSNTSGGDGGPTFFFSGAHSIRDLSHNVFQDDFNTTILEFPDIINPVLLNATVKYSNGTMFFALSETVNSSTVDLTKGFISDYLGAKNVSLAGANVLPTFTTTLTIVLTEIQRVTAIELSNTPGGDGSSIFFDGGNGFLSDIADNNNTIAAGLDVSEEADVIIPTLLFSHLNLSTGILEITADETIDASSVNASRIYISDGAGNRDISLEGASVTLQDGVQVTLSILESQRAHAISISGTRGGNGDAVVLDLDAGAFTDIGQVQSIEQLGITVNETTDSITPVLLNGTIDYNDGKLFLQASETIDMTPSGFYAVVNFLQISAKNEANDASPISLEGATFEAIDGVLVTLLFDGGSARCYGTNF